MPELVYNNKMFKIYAQGDANQYVVLDNTDNWLCAVHFNGEMKTNTQIRALSIMIDGLEHNFINIITDKMKDE